MRRLLRILLNTATVLSLVLCVVTMAGWVRSYQARDMVWWSFDEVVVAKPRLSLWMDTYRGGLYAAIVTNSFMESVPPPGPGWVRFSPMSYIEVVGSQGTFFNRFGFALYYLHNSSMEQRCLSCPFWFIMLLTAILPGARLVAWRRRARRSRMHPGFCRHCGYDCRATPDRCPECGTPAAARERRGRQRRQADGAG